MINIRRNSIILCLVLMLGVLSFMLAGCGKGNNGSSASDGTAASVPEYTEFDDLSGKRVSMLTGAPFEELIKSKVPDVGEFSYFNSMSDMIIALVTEKTDAILMNNAVSELAVNRNPELALFPQSLQDGVFGIAFAKGSPEREKWQAAYDRISEEAKQEAWEKWTGSDESIKKLPEQDWPGLAGTVVVAACDTLEPMSYAGEGGKLQGFDLEMILMMAKELDVHVEFVGMEFSAVLSYVESGKALMGAGSIIVTPERQEAVDFVEYYPAAFTLAVRAADEEASGDGSLDQLDGKRIGIQTGSIFQPFVAERLPNAKIYYFNSSSDLIAALKSNKIDAFPMDEATLNIIMEQEDRIDHLDEYLDQVEVGMVFAKTDSGQQLCDEISSWLRELKESGELERLREKWYEGSDEEKTVLDYKSLPAVNGTLTLATEGALMPFSYVSDGELVGYEIDLVTRFCEEHGYALQIKMINFDGILMAVQEGQVDFGASGFAITPERQESVLFSEPYYHSGTVMAVLKDAQSGNSFWDTVVSSFEKTFLRENRWQLFLSGIATTLLITVLAILLGSLLGFAVYMLCRNGNPVANIITRIIVWLIDGMPVVVLLMILYYIIFAKAQVSGVFVSVVGFTLIFGSAVFSMLKSSVATVDSGQSEAALALGYSNRRAFFRIVLPQAMLHFVPAYTRQITALIKATAVVGYIAIMDLTKIADIVRSRTYEAFFPLIAIAVIYFLLAWFLNLIVKQLGKRFDTKKRRQIKMLKGVKLHD